MSSGTREGFLHSALFFRSDDEFLSATVPFVQEGLAAGEPALIVCDDRRNALLAGLLPHDDRVTVLPRGAVYTRPAHVGASYERLVNGLLSGGAPGTRLVSEPSFGTEAWAWRAWTAFEAAANVAFAPLPFTAACGYDLRVLPGPMRLDVERSHPYLLTAAGSVANDAYMDPAALIGGTPPPDPLEATPPALDLVGIPDRAAAARARDRVRSTVDAACPYPPVGSDFLVAVAEVVANALEHGRPPLRIRVWTTPSRLLCTVTDHGPGSALHLAGLSRGHIDRDGPGAGLWLARQTCDHLDAYPTAEGFTVRLTSAVPGADPGREGGRAEATARRVQAARRRAAEILRRADRRPEATDNLDAHRRRPLG
ncbi:MAG TPA: sensor histidine kinase [Geodermatophilus sp.]|nr:sensor histidine kinase [Geodermatophilus sp.]